MTVVVRDAWHYIDVGTPTTLPLGGFIEEIAPAPTKQQWAYMLRLAEARKCNIAWRRGYRPVKEKECIFKED